MPLQELNVAAQRDARRSQTAQADVGALAIRSPVAVHDQIDLGRDQSQSLGGLQNEWNKRRRLQKRAKSPTILLRAIHGVCASISERPCDRA